MTTAAWTEITTADELVGLLGEPHARAAGKGGTADPSGSKRADGYYGPSYEEGLYR